MNGVKSVERTLPVQQTEHLIDLGELQNGIYLISIQENGHKPITKRLVKQSMY